MLHPQLQESFVPSVPITVCGQAPPQIYPGPKFAVSSVKFIMRFEVILRLTAPESWAAWDWSRAGADPAGLRR